MINLNNANYLLSDRDVLDNIAAYISNNVGGQDWEAHIDDISGYIAAGIHWKELEVNEYLKRKVK